MLGSDGKRVSGPVRSGLLWSEGNVGGVPVGPCGRLSCAALPIDRIASAKIELAKYSFFMDHLASEESPWRWVDPVSKDLDVRAKVPGQSSRKYSRSEPKTAYTPTCTCLAMAAISEFEVGNVYVGSGEMFLIAGPCVIESEAHAVKMAQAISAITRELKVPYIFKASYDKANRTSLKSFRGPGVKEGSRILRKVAETCRVPVLTDVHQVTDIEQVAEAVDVLQIPAFLSRQTDLIVTAARSGRAVNVKKGQFVAPHDMRYAVEKCRESGNDRVFLTERGSSFGYNNLVVDMRSLPIMREYAPVVFDATHSVQLPSGSNGVSAGQPQFIPVLARAAVAAGVDGLFMEVHDNPAAAKSDGPNALPLERLRDVLASLLAVHKAAQTATRSS